MRLTYNKKQTDVREPAELTAELYECHQKQEFLCTSVRTLLQFIKEFALDLKELGSDRFKRDISVLEEKFDAGKKQRKTQACFHKQKKHVRKFIDRQKNYLAERENELKDIIDLLAKAMVALDTDNQQYNQKIYKQSEKIEQITRLDDIKKIKQSLKQELENIQQTVRDKQNRDSKKLKLLSKKVSTLNHELKRAKVDSITDGLTGIYNRKAFDRHIQELISKNPAAPTSFAILMVDIDNFKDVNDSYGHQTGDRVLLALADKCRNNIRSEDFIAVMVVTNLLWCSRIHPCEMQAKKPKSCARPFQAPAIPWMISKPVIRFPSPSPSVSVSIGKAIRLKPLPIAPTRRSIWRNVSEKTGSHLKMK